MMQERDMIWYVRSKIMKDVIEFSKSKRNFCFPFMKGKSCTLVSSKCILRMFLPFQKSFCLKSFDWKRKKKQLFIMLWQAVNAHLMLFRDTQGIPTWQFASIRCNSSVSQLKQIPFHEVNYKNWQTFRGQKNCSNFHLKRNYPLAKFCLPN